MKEAMRLKGLFSTGTTQGASLQRQIEVSTPCAVARNTDHLGHLATLCEMMTEFGMIVMLNDNEGLQDAYSADHMLVELEALNSAMKQPLGARQQKPERDKT